jgi:hypothetical protein
MIRAIAVSLVALVASAACQGPDPNARSPVTGPDQMTFPLLHKVLDHRCGSLDCHGTRYRNLRMWGSDGMRLSYGDVPGGAPTTTDELNATYQSIVELEPELMSAVVADHGANPERLTLVRKARGTEAHKGGAVVTPGDARDRCILSWLAGAADVLACSAALAQF